MRYVAIISCSECALFGDGVTLRCGGDGGVYGDKRWRKDGGDK